jgi:Raf kinase inhibitor-like YbhB/YbcL family protein
MRLTLPVVAALLLAASANTSALSAEKSGEASNVEFTGHVLEPHKAKLTADRLGDLKVPDGFKVSVFAKDLVNPRMIAVAPDGTVYVTRRAIGDVVMLRDTDGDGRADLRTVVANRPVMHGIAIDGDDMYLATVKDVYQGKILADGTLSQLTRIIDDLPDAGQHMNRTIGIGPDKMLYISVGSTCNACIEPNPENATMLRASRDGRKRTIFASGLRNTIGFDWQPQTNEMYGFDNNIDWHGDNQPAEELNHIEHGKKYGWPYVLAGDFLNPQDDPPGDITLEQWAAASQKPVLTYTAHGAPMQMAFYEGAAFPAEYKGNAFVAMRGSWNRKPPSGYEIVRIVFEDGKPKRLESFLSGFLKEDRGEYTRMARPVGVAVANDGSLLVGDDENGVIYRVSYDAAAAAKTATVPAQQSPSATKQAPPEPIALEALDSRTLSSIEVRSRAFEANGPIPLRFSDYGGKISPPVAWTAGPVGTKSYAVVVDDPDAKPQLVNHWIVFNLGADITALPEGVPGDPALVLPKAAQGTNTRGSVGFTGPHPPAGDPAHHYHFQIFALDKLLDLPPAPDREQLLASMRGHVLAAGEIVGTFRRDSAVEAAVDAASDLH